MTQTIFHLIFVTVFIGFTAIRTYYHRRARKMQGKVEYKEGNLHTGLRLLFGLPYMLLVFIYLFYPPILAWAQISLPQWLQTIGAVFGLASIGLIWWVQWALDANFSTTLHVRENHTLITKGPYRWVRHPMYTVLYIQLIGLFLLSRNWFIGLIPLIALTMIIVTRLHKEEAIMGETFGDQYVHYQQNTGRFLPRWR